MDCGGTTRVLFYSPTPVVPYCADCNNKYWAALQSMGDGPTEEETAAELYGVDAEEEDENG